MRCFQMFLSLFSVISFLFLAACSPAKKKDVVLIEPAFKARVDLQATQGATPNGSIFFTEAFGKVNVEFIINGLKPNEEYAMFVHQYGDCRGKKGLSAGNFYLNKKQSPLLFKGKSNKLGKLIGESVLDGFSLNGRRAPIIGRSVVLHMDLNDRTGQFNGRFEKRLACGIIGVIKE